MPTYVHKKQTSSETCIPKGKYCSQKHNCQCVDCKALTIPCCLSRDKIRVNFLNLLFQIDSH